MEGVSYAKTTSSRPKVMLSLRKSVLTKWQFFKLCMRMEHLSKPCWTLNLADDRFSQANWGHRLHTRDEYSDRHGQHLLVHGSLSAAWVSYLPLILNLSLSFLLSMLKNRIVLTSACAFSSLLWGQLTGREHLLFYGRLKNLKGPELTTVSTTPTEGKNTIRRIFGVLLDYSVL